MVADRIYFGWSRCTRCTPPTSVKNPRAIVLGQFTDTSGNEKCGKHQQKMNGNEIQQYTHIICTTYSYILMISNDSQDFCCSPPLLYQSTTFRSPASTKSSGFGGPTSGETADLASTFAASRDVSKPTDTVGKSPQDKLRCCPMGTSWVKLARACHDVTCVISMQHVHDIIYICI